jgi:hypothetical protein
VIVSPGEDERDRLGREVAPSDEPFVIGFDAKHPGEPDPEANAAFRERLELVQDILRHVVALVKVVIAEHVSRRGIDPSRLIVEVTAVEPGRVRPDRKPS